ncbi:hypothetical protein RQP46_005219 [Phenoliferia psychrophenolica]
MSARGDNAPKTLITSLAAEIVTRIVRLSSPAPSWDNATERSTHLRNLALVCRTFRVPAQEELFRHVVLPSVHASRLFVAVLKSDAGARFASTPRSLRAGVGGIRRIHQWEFGFTFIVKRCSRLGSLWLTRIASLDVAALTSGTDIRELFCFDCRFASAIESPKLETSPVVRLGIISCLAVSFLDYRSFPSLKSLDASIHPDRDNRYLRNLVNSLGGQLSSLSIDSVSDPSFYLNRIEPRLLKNLTTFNSRLSLDDLTTFLASVPSRIRHLRAQPTQDALASTLDVWASLFTNTHLEGSRYRSLGNLEHFRVGIDDVDGHLAQELKDELEVLWPAVRVTCDDGSSSPKVEDSLDAKFNPAFWAFVDDAEAAPAEAKR